MATTEEFTEGRILTITPSAAASIIAGDFVTMTASETGSTLVGDYSDTEVIGIALKSSTSTSITVPVATTGVFSMLSTTGFTAGKTIITESYFSPTDGSAAGKVIGRAIGTAAGGGTGKILLRV